SNRTPTPSERRIGREFLKYLIDQFPNVRLLAIGRQAQQQLAEIGISSIGLRHPARGGANLFRNQLHELMSDPLQELKRRWEF
ncbi:MAG: uracil-DNA glycosylase, partial [SAR324 cluster bacterium]|nr:uracil-DNA glycosylase [SAR324 cluster bacterium]